MKYIWKTCDLELTCPRKILHNHIRWASRDTAAHCQKPITVKPTRKLWPDKADHTNEEGMRAATCGEKVTEEG